MRFIETERGVVEVERVCELGPGDWVLFRGVELKVSSVNGVVRFMRETGNSYEHKIGAKSQEWVEILKSNTHEKNK